VQYEGVIRNTMAVRTDSGVFDVSHMGELESRPARARTPAVHALERPRAAGGRGGQYTLLTNESGGIVTT